MLILIKSGLDRAEFLLLASELNAEGVAILIEQLRDLSIQHFIDSADPPIQLKA